MDTQPNQSNEERMKILQMLSEGKISAEEASGLLGAVGQERHSTRPLESESEYQAHFFRVRVTDTMTGKTRANVTIPLGLAEWGLRIGAQFAPEVGNINLQELGELVRSGSEGKIVDVVDEVDGEHVEIFID
jgi:hypothetical protein